MTFTYVDSRSDMAEFLPAGARKILDVGCSSGAFGRELRHLGAIERLIGVEPNPDAAAMARAVYDTVVDGLFPDVVVKLPTGTYDAIFFNDVLEHMTQPELALRAARELLDSGGAVVCSIPNVRHISVVAPLLIRNEFRYRDSGLLDSTHVRFFTGRSIRRLFDQEGWVIERMEQINHALRVGEPVSRSWLPWLSRLTRGRTDSFFAIQYVVVARPMA